MDTTCSTKEQNHLMIFLKMQEFPVIHLMMYGTNMVFLQLQRCKFDLNHLQDYLCNYIKRQHQVLIFSFRNGQKYGIYHILNTYISSTVVFFMVMPYSFITERGVSESDKFRYIFVKFCKLLFIIKNELT